MTVTSPNLTLPGKVRVPVPDSTVHLVPVAGPRGPIGPAGDAAASLGYVHTQSSPAALVQVNHGLLFRPGGVVAKDTEGRVIDWDTLSWPTVSILEIDFGVPFSGTITIS